jgi:hypothetical protein
MARFVVLEHDHPYLHWDFMLECSDLLRTWRLKASPAPGQTISAVSLGNHRRFYLDYEGPVSNDRGWVVQWDSGTFTWLADEGERVAVCLQGARLQGTASLCRTEGEEWEFLLLNQ